MTRYKLVKIKPKSATKIVMRRDDYPKKGYETWYYANKSFTKYWKVEKKKIQSIKKEKFTSKDRKELMVKIRKASEKQDHDSMLKLSREYLFRSD